MKFFLATSKPEQAIILYHNYINGWLLQPFWSLGFHQSKWGYGTSQDLVTVQQKYAENNLPIDTIWSDIDYMRQYIDFTVDTTRFNITQMQQLMNINTTQGVHWVPIIDAGISILQDQYCIDKNCFIKSNRYNGQPLMGCVWPGKVHYPDFNNPDSYEMWYQGLSNLTTQYNLTPSGFWIDMNEYSNFVNGEIPENGSCSQSAEEQIPRKSFLSKSVQNGANPYTDLPFNPVGDSTPLDTKTLSLDAYFYNNPDSSLVYYPNQTLYHFDFHNMLGFSEGIATNRAMDRMGFKLKFILTRSQMFGSGKYVQEWTGDNLATWEFLQLSIPQVLDAQLFAIPLSGADICGFGGNTTPELCARWMSLGTLYPFARNHNSEGDIPQEPYAFPQAPYVLEASRKGLQLRYSLLKHFYQLFIKKAGLGTIINPLFFEFPNDTNLLAIDDEFFIGDALLAAPIVTQGDATNQYTQRYVVFPAGQLFFDYYKGFYYN